MNALSTAKHNKDTKHWEKKLDLVAPMMTGPQPVNSTTDTDKHPKNHNKPNFVGHIDNRINFITTPNPPVCDPYFG